MNSDRPGFNRNDRLRRGSLNDFFRIVEENKLSLAKMEGDPQSAAKEPLNEDDNMEVDVEDIDGTSSGTMTKTTRRGRQSGRGKSHKKAGRGGQKSKAIEAVSTVRVINYLDIALDGSVLRPPISVSCVILHSVLD